MKLPISSTPHRELPTAPLHRAPHSSTPHSSTPQMELPTAPLYRLSSILNKAGPGCKNCHDQNMAFSCITCCTLAHTHTHTHTLKWKVRKVTSLAGKYRVLSAVHMHAHTHTHTLKWKVRKVTSLAGKYRVLSAVHMHAHTHTHIHWNERWEKWLHLPVSIGSFLHHVGLPTLLHLLWVAEVEHVELHVDRDGELTPDVIQLACVGNHNFLEKKPTNTAKIKMFVSCEAMMMYWKLTRFPAEFSF